MKFILGVLLLFVFIAAVSGSYYYFKHYLPKTSVAETVEKSWYEAITFDVVSEWDDAYQLHVMYPITPNAKVNNAARTEIDTYLAEFRSIVNSKPNTSDRPYELTLNGDVGYYNDSVLNLVYVGKRFLGEIEETIEVNRLFDMKTGERISLHEYLKGTNYLEVLSKAARSALPAILGSDADVALMNKGTEPNVSNSENFEIVDQNQITLIFQPGQVASVEKGIVKLPLSTDILEVEKKPSLSELLPQVSDAITQQELQEAKPPALPQQNAQPVQLSTAVDCSTSKCIALTFDDGPGAPTSELLDILKQNNAKATFFVIGRQVPGRATVVKSIHDNGHELGIHTWDHINMKHASAESVSEQITKTNQAIVDAVGAKSVIVRPPFGSYSQENIAMVGLPFILWNVDPNDWKDKDATTVHDRVLAGAKSGAIILSHDIHPTSVEAYKKIIPELQAQRYTLVTISDLLDINPNRPQAKAYFSR